MSRLVCHYDHSFDTATWAHLTSAPVIGSQTTAYQCIAQGVRADLCHVVSGGEVLNYGHGLTCRMIRTNHSGDNTNPEQHDPVELAAVPRVDPATRGLRAGVAEDFPNGGGGRAYLFTLDTRSGRRSLLYTSSLSAYDLREPIVVDGVDHGAPLDNITAALADAELDGVDLWLGVGGTAVAELVLPVVKPKTYIPNHWNGQYSPFFAGLPFPFSIPPLDRCSQPRGITLLPQRGSPAASEHDHVQDVAQRSEGVARQQSVAVGEGGGHSGHTRLEAGGGDPGVDPQ
jgi:hypothetical protein